MPHRSHPFRRRPIKRRSIAALPIACLAFLVSLPMLLPAREQPPQGAGQITDQVSAVLDGDTLRIGTATYRLWGIDAPDRDGTPQSAYFDAATAALRLAIAAQPVRCKFTGQTSYGRYTARCHNHRGQDLADVLVHAGYAVDWPRYSQGHYAAAETAARRQRLGLWGHLDHSWR